MSDFKKPPIVNEVNFSSDDTKKEIIAETDYLLSSPKNAEMLMKSIEEVKNGNLIEFDPTKD